MSGKKKRVTKKVKQQRKILTLVALVTLIIIILCLLLFKLLVSDKDYYEIESRVSNVISDSSNNTENYRTVGWLKVQGTDIDLPILAGIDDDAHFPVEKEKYVWNVSSDGEFRNKIDIMGHNIYNLSSSPKVSSPNFKRFEELMSFVYYDEAKESKYIQLTIDGKDYLYKIFSVDFIHAVDVDRFPTGKYTKDDLKYQIKLFKDSSIYDYDVDVNENDNLISLMTCTRFFGTKRYIDFLVNGRLVREGERIDNYSITKNDNYKKVEKILEGDDQDESEDSM